MFTEFDVIISIVVLIFSIIGFFWGAIKYFLSFFSWIGAGISTLYFYPYALSKAKEVFPEFILVSFGVIILVFILSYVAFALFNAMVLKSIENFHKGPLDRALGTILGFITGFFVVSLLHLVIEAAADDTPKWLKEGQTYAYTKTGAELLSTVDYDEVKEEVEKQGGLNLEDTQLGDNLEETLETAESLEDSIQ